MSIDYSLWPGIDAALKNFSLVITLFFTNLRPILIAFLTTSPTKFLISRGILYTQKIYQNIMKQAMKKKTCKPSVLFVLAQSSFEIYM